MVSLPNAERLQFSPFFFFAWEESAERCERMRTDFTQQISIMNVRASAEERAWGAKNMIELLLAAPRAIPYVAS